MLSQLSQRFTTGRVVALLTPTVIAPLAGSAAVLAAKLGMDVDAKQLEAVFIAGVTSALGIGALWLKGWQDWEKREAETPAGVSSDLRLEEAQAPRSIAAADPPAGNGSVDVADIAAEDASDDDLEADGFDEVLDDLDEDLDLSDEEELVALGEE
jgi:hypothetical protein